MTRPVAMPVTMTTIEPAFPDKMELLLPVTAFESVTPEIIIIFTSTNFQACNNVSSQIKQYIIGKLCGKLQCT